MTHETRIGLLVGLVFIVMFGLVLSELMRTDIPATATAEQEGDRPIELGSTIPPAVAPQAVESPPAVARREAPARTRREPVALTAEASPGEAQPAPRAAPPRPTPRPVVHTVSPGDTLTALARRYYGPQHGDKHELIFRANRSVLADESSLVVGQALVIPPLDGTPVRQASRREPNRMDLSREPASAPPRTCTVCPGDTLTRIARRELGDSSHAAALRIFNANRDRLTDPDRLTVGMELRIPQ